MEAIQEQDLVLSDHFAVYSDSSPYRPATFVRKLNAYINPTVREPIHEAFIRKNGKYVLAKAERHFSHFEPVGFVPHTLMYDPLQSKQIEIVS